MSRHKQLRTAVLALTFLLIGAWFTVNSRMPEWAHMLSSLSVVVFAVPAMWAAFRWVGRSSAILLFVGFAVLAFAIESFAVATGFPYGSFEYSDFLGWKLFGLVPWTVAFAWTPLVLAGYAVAAKISDNPLVRITVTAILTASSDLVLDPGAVHLGFWRYEAAGAFYGVPASNFLGWLLSGIVAATLMEVFVRRVRPLLPVPVQLALSGLLVIFFWSAVDLFSGLPVAAFVGFVLFVLLTAFYAKNYYAFDDMIVIVDDENLPLATARKLDAHNSETMLHRAFSVFLFNRSGELLLQRRASGKKTWPGVWSNSCCGHVMLHEPVGRAAARRLRHELGISGTKLRMALPDFRYRAEKDGIVEHEICPVLVGFTDDEPMPNPDEVGDHKWVDWHAFVTDIKSGDSGYSPWAVEEVQQLAKSDDFQRYFRENVRPRPRGPVTEAVSHD